MKKENSIIVATPVQQHSFRLVEALKKAGYLNKFYTTVYVKEKSLFWKIMGKMFKKRGKNAIKAKKNAEIGSHTKTLCRFLGLIFYLAVRINYKLSTIIYVYLTKRFGKKIAKRAIKENASAVIMFDYTAVECFKYLKKKAPNIVRILDMSSIPTMSIDRILDNEEKNGYIEHFKYKRMRYSKKYCNYFHQEIEDTNYFLVSGTFSYRCLLEENVKPEQCFIVPYGVDLKSFYPNYPKVENGEINFVYTGRIEGAKGIIYLLEAFKKLYENGYKFKLHLVGSVTIDEKYLKKCLDFSVFHGHVSKKQLIELYHNSHVFVMCSLWEGLSLSVIEALACGLPCLITTSTGWDNRIEDGVNGFIIPPANVDAIYEKAKWFIENPTKLAEMSNNTCKAIKNLTWDDYNRNIANSIDKVFYKV